MLVNEPSAHSRAAVEMHIELSTPKDEVPREM